ncbi:MAG: hypothetical protein H6Q47_299, partial [Deltaproteobacteria bacterium]|nr:hypothetical protein [Deltaproteobacteria bacterium]
FVSPFSLIEESFFEVPFKIMEINYINYYLTLKSFCLL